MRNAGRVLRPAHTVSNPSAALVRALAAGLAITLPPRAGRTWSVGATQSRLVDPAAPELSLSTSIVGKQWHQRRRIGTTPAGNRIPARARLVTDDRIGGEFGGVVAHRDVMEGLVVLRAAGDLVDGRVDEAEMPLRVLVGEGDDPGPGRRSSARAAVSADRVTTAAIARDDRKPGVGIGVSGDIGDTAHGADTVDAVLIRGPSEEMTEPPARRLNEGVRVAIGKAPRGFADPGAGRVARVERGAPGTKDEWVGGDEDDLLGRGVAGTSAAECRDEGARFASRTDVAGGRDDGDVVGVVVL